MRNVLTHQGFPDIPGVSATTPPNFGNFSGFRFDQQSAQGNRRHYALQQNGIGGKTNILTITIENIKN